MMQHRQLLCQNELLPDGTPHPPTPLQAVRELPTVWAFSCPRCGALQVWDKHKVGGTLGAGARDDGTRGLIAPNWHVPMAQQLASGLWVVGGTDNGRTAP